MTPTPQLNLEDYYTAHTRILEEKVSHSLNQQTVTCQGTTAFDPTPPL